MATEIGGIKIFIGVDTDQLDKGLQRARKGLNAVGKWAGAASAAAVAAGAAIVKANLQSIDALAKTADKLGVTTEALQGLRHAAELTGVSAGQLDTALQRMTRRVSEAAQGTGAAQSALEELNLSARELNQLSPDEQMMKIAGALSEVGVQSDRVRLAMRLFDTEGVALVNTLGQGEDALRAMVAEVDEFGASISRIDAAKIEAANDAITRTELAAKGIGTALTIEVAPILEHVVREINKAAKESGGWGEVMRDAIDGVVVVLGVFADGIRGIQVIVKSLQIAFQALGVGAIQSFLRVTRGIDDVINFTKRGVNELIDVINRITPGEGFAKLELGASNATKFLEGTLSEASRMLGESVNEWRELMNEPLPSVKFKNIVEEAREASQAAAEALHEQNEIFTSDYTGPGSRAYTEKILEEQAYLNSQLVDMEQTKNDSMLSTASGFFGNMATLTRAGSKRLFEIGKAAAISQAVVSAYEGISLTMSKYPYPWNIAMAAAHGVAAFAQVRNIEAQQYGSRGGGRGGFAGGGGSAATPAAAPATPTVNVELVGSEGATFSRDQVIGLIGQINDAIGDGATIGAT